MELRIGFIACLYSAFALSNEMDALLSDSSYAPYGRSDGQSVKGNRKAETRGNESAEECFDSSGIFRNVFCPGSGGGVGRRKQPDKGTEQRSFNSEGMPLLK